MSTSTYRALVVFCLITLTAGCSNGSASDSSGDDVASFGPTPTAPSEIIGDSAIDGTTTDSTPPPEQPTTTRVPTTIAPIEHNAPDARTVPVVDPPIEAVGTNSGEQTLRAQMRLLELGFWLDEAAGEYGTTTSQAVLAFQKYYGLETDGSLGPITAETLTNVTEAPRGRSTAGTLVEVDKTKQLLFIVSEGQTQWIINTSTGSEVPYEEPDQNSPGKVQVGDSVTRTGQFKVYREREEGWWEGDLGEIYRPKYFDGGIALHGSYNIPDYPASHGCVRLSIPAMDWIWETGIIPRGTPVWVHGAIPAGDV